MMGTGRTLAACLLATCVGGTAWATPVNGGYSMADGFGRDAPLDRVLEVPDDMTGTIAGLSDPAWWRGASNRDCGLAAGAVVKVVGVDPRYGVLLAVENDPPPSDMMISGSCPVGFEVFVSTSRRPILKWDPPGTMASARSARLASEREAAEVRIREMDASGLRLRAEAETRHHPK